MRGFRFSKWVWYGVLAAVVAGVFVPTMFAHARTLETVPSCVAAGK